MKNLKIDSSTGWYVIALSVVFVAAFIYTFDSKIHIGGDDCNYFIYSTSIVEGHGYADISNCQMNPTSVFPPGYPILMSAVRVFTDSVVAQKILNGIFLLVAALFLFYFTKKKLLNPALAFVVGVVAVLNFRVLEFASMMMSEMSYLMFSTFIIYLLYLIDKQETAGKKWWKSVSFYLLIFASGYAFTIRTQGVAIIAAVFIYMLLRSKWLQAVGYGVGSYLTTLVWTIRNAILGLGASRYLDQITMVNQWKPEEGYLSFPDIIIRGFETLQMLVTKAIPNTIMPSLDVDYETATTFSEWLMALILIAVITIGFKQFKKLFPFFMAYTVCTLGLICLWSAPSENRYITTLIPILEMGLVVGVYRIVESIFQRIGIKRMFSPLWLLLPIVILVTPRLKMQHEIANMDYPPSYTNFFRIAENMRGKLPRNAVVCSRKPQLFYMYSNTFVCNYKYSLDDKEVIKTLLDTKADYVILEQLGYASTSRYLLPAIMKNQELFVPLIQTPEPATYLFQFDREKAAQKLLQWGK